MAAGSGLLWGQDIVMAVVRESSLCCPSLGVIKLSGKSFS